MPWLIVILGYFLGSVPTAYVAGHLLKRGDIRRMGDGNIGARNAFHHLGAKTGIGIFIIDAGKGALAVLVAQAAGLPLVAVLFTGVAAVIGHNWPVFLGFRGGAGEKHYYRCFIGGCYSADADYGGPGACISLYLAERAKGQCYSIRSSAVVRLVAGDIRVAHWL